MSLRSPLGRALGDGAGGGVHHWWVQRVGALLLLPLGAWFMIALVGLPDLDYDTVHAWLREPLHAVLMLLFVAVAAHHSQLGLEVVAQDYVPRKGARTALLLILQFVHLAVTVGAAFAVLEVALGSAA